MHCGTSVTVMPTEAGGSLWVAGEQGEVLVERQVVSGGTSFGRCKKPRF